MMQTTFAAERRHLQHSAHSVAAAINQRSISPATGCSAVNPLAAAVARQDRQTDKWMDA